MKLTLLEIVQRALSAIDSINITTLSDDSIEAEQLVLITQRVYEEILSRHKWKFLRTEGTLDIGTNAWEMEVPQYLISLERIKYNNEDVNYLDPEDFKDLIDSRIDEDNDDVNDSGIRLDSDPQYWTSYNTTTIVFDSYDSDTESHLTSSNSYIMYLERPSSNLENDSDIPELPFRFHHVLLYGVLAYAFEELKQDPTKGAIYRREYKAGLSRMLRWANNIEDGKSKYNSNVDYGRSAK